MDIPDLETLRLAQQPSRLRSLTLSSILQRTERPTAFFVTIELIDYGRDVLNEHLAHMTRDLLEHPELAQHEGMATSYGALQRLVWLIQQLNERVNREESEEELIQLINWYSETLEQVARMYAVCTDELMDAVVVCSLTIYILASSLPNIVPILSFEQNGSADLVSIGKSVTELAESMEGVHVLPIDWKPQKVFLPREEDMWKIYRFADPESKPVIGYGLLKLSKTYVEAVEHQRFDNMACWAITSPKLMLLCRKRNPYALLLFSYFLATMYLTLPLYDKMSRVKQDVLELREQVSDNFRPHLDWPVEICCSDRDASKDFELFANGKMREIYLREGEELGKVRGRPEDEEKLRRDYEEMET
ncbi:hypothetical protein CJU89_2954 [Yarrowia sp. B02]|nr:hypothetical protein CJU89_2954 [Yarrowia sp. B02]